MWQVITLAALLALLGGLSYLPIPGAPVNLITGTGFVLLAAFTMGELFRRIRLPALLGYIAAGILFGPDIVELVLGADTRLTLLPADITAPDKLAYVEILTVGVIGTLGGGELKVDALRGQVGSIIRIIVLSFLAIVPATGFMVYGLALYAPDLVPFLQQLDHASLVGASLLFGILGFAMSPAATLAIIQENRAEGPYTSLVLGVVMVADLVLVGTFLLGKSLAKILETKGTLALEPVLQSLPATGAHFGWAIVIGIVTGAVFILYFRFVAREMILFTVGTIFVATYASEQLNAESLLAFITAGFIVQNFSKHGHDMIEALERISLPVFVVYFSLQAVGLNLLEMPKYLAIIGILTVIRTAALYGSINLATKFGHWALPENDRNYLWMSFFSRGGVDLVLASLLANSAVFAQWGQNFLTVIMGIVVVHIVAGPPLLKLALDRVGETAGERERESRDEDLIEEHEEYEEHEEFLEDPLPVPDFADDELHDRVTFLGDRLRSLYRERFLEPVRTHQKAMVRVHRRIDEAIEEAVDDLEEILQEVCAADDPDLERAYREIRQRHADLRHALRPQIDAIENLGAAPVTPESVDELLDEVRAMEQFDRHYRVDWGPNFSKIEEGDPWWRRALKRLRGVRTSLFGPGRRNVPVGRLWRYFVELSLPEYLAGAAGATSQPSEEYWIQLAIELREMDALFETTVKVIAHGAFAENAADPDDEDEDRPEVLSLPISASGAHVPALEALDLPDEVEEALEETPDFVHVELLAPGDEAEEEPEAGPAERCLEYVDGMRREFQARTERLRQAELSFYDRLLDRLAVAVENAFTDFLRGAERAGTIELPGFLFRPSRRFDRAQRAETRLDERLRRQEDLVRGCQGWIVADQYLTEFLHWFHEYRGRVESMLDRALHRNAIDRLETLESRCSERPAADDDSELEAWPTWLEEELLPSLQRARDGINHAMMEVTQRQSTQNLLDILEKRVARFPRELRMVREWREDQMSPGIQVELETVPFRNWFTNELIRETALRFVEMNERTERSLRRTLLALEEVQELLVVNLRDHALEPGGATEMEVDELAVDALDRAEHRLERLVESLEADERELRDWIDDELARTVTGAAGPFLARRVGETVDVSRQAPSAKPSRRGRGPLASALEPVRRGLGRARDWVAPRLRQAREELREALSDEPREPSRSDVRERLITEDRASIHAVPVVYRRLFRPDPVDIPDFYIDRPNLERQCIEATREWSQGRSNSVLVYGDRGTGKRTLIQHLLPVEIFRETDRQSAERSETIRFGSRPNDESAICRKLAPLVGGDEFSDLETLAREIQSREGRQVVCIEDLQSLFHRTPGGLERLERFLRFTSATDDDILWFLVVGRPTATYLDTAIDLFDYFTHTLEVGPLPEDRLERMIMTRHRVSGFNLRFQSPERRTLDRLRHPTAAAEARQHPRRAYFDRLGRLSRGNPMLALLYWLESVGPHPRDDSGFRIRPLPKQEIELAAPLSTDQRLLAASLVRHGYASVEDLAEIFRVEPSAMGVELEHLRRLGLVESVPGRRHTYRLRRLAEGLLTPELRDQNLL